MRKLFVYILLCLIDIVLLGCNNKPHCFCTPTHGSLPVISVSIDNRDKDSIYFNQSYHALVAMVVLDKGDTIYADTIRIKTRGNTTFRADKKSFSIKFPKQVRILGLRKSKSYTLLANVYDDTFMHNAIAFDIAQKIGLPSPTYTFVRLYINNEYMGLYQMTDKIRASKHGLNITDLGKLNECYNPHPMSSYMVFNNNYNQNGDILGAKGVILENDPDDITGGYILDNGTLFYHKSISGFISHAGDGIRIRAPKYASEKEVEFIARRYNLMEDAILDPNGINPQSNRHYSEYMDMTSFVQYYIINELLVNQDAGFASFYMYKDEDAINTKICAGPVWDFDKSLGGRRCDPSCKDYKTLYAASMLGEMGEKQHSMNLFYHLYKHPEFRDSVKVTWFETVRPVVVSYIMSKEIDSLYCLICHDVRKEAILYSLSVRRMKEFLYNRINFLDWLWTTSDDSITCVVAQYNYAKGLANDRFVQFYIPKDVPTSINTMSGPYHGSPKPVNWVYRGTDNVVKQKTIFQNGDSIVQQMREPSWIEVEYSRFIGLLYKHKPL